MQSGALPLGLARRERPQAGATARKDAHADPAACSGTCDGLAGATDPLQQFLRLFKRDKLLFGLLEFARVYATTRASVLHRETQVEHLVKQHVFGRQPRYGGLVQQFAYTHAVIPTIVLSSHAPARPA